jgi:uncharacterized protein (DUF302 family)
MMAKPSDLTEIESPFSFAATLAKLTQAIEAAGMTIFAKIDHAAGAAQAEMAMPPTLVLIYGNPRGGTPIMQASPWAALDLPLKALVREAGGKTFVAFRPAAPMLRSDGVPEALASRLDGAQALIAKALSSAMA